MRNQANASSSQSGERTPFKDLTNNNAGTNSGQQQHNSASWYSRLSDDKKAEYLEWQRIARQRRKNEKQSTTVQLPRNGQGPKQQSGQSWYARLSNEKKSEYLLKQRISHQNKKAAAVNVTNQDGPQSLASSLNYLHHTPPITNTSTPTYGGACGAVNPPVKVGISQLGSTQCVHHRPEGPTDCWRYMSSPAQGEAGYRLCITQCITGDRDLGSSVYQSTSDMIHILIHIADYIMYGWKCCPDLLEDFLLAFLVTNCNFTPYVLAPKVSRAGLMPKC